MTTVATLAGRVLLPFAAGYFLSYLYRTVNAVLAPEIARSIALDAADIGLMTGAYFIAFAAFQLPLGLLLDRYGPRRVEATLLLVAAAGAFAFALADTPGTLIAGRALIGLGVSACLMAALKANIQWFPPDRLPLLNGLILSAGGLGAVAATAPVQAALALTDWRGVFAVLGGLTVISAATLFLVVPDREPHPGTEGLPAQLAEIGRIMASESFRRVAPLAMVSMGGSMAIQGLWAGAWLRDVAALAPAEVAGALAAMAAAMAVGFATMGAVAERLGRLGVPSVRVATAGLLVYILAGAAMAAGWTAAPRALTVVYGFSGTAGSLLYACLGRAYPARLAGRANTSLNLTIFIAAFVLQWGIGALLGMFPARPDGGWPAEGYRLALAIPVALQALALVWFIPMVKESPAPPRST